MFIQSITQIFKAINSIMLNQQNTNITVHIKSIHSLKFRLLSLLRLIRNANKHIAYRYYFRNP